MLGQDDGFEDEEDDDDGGPDSFRVALDLRDGLQRLVESVDEAHVLGRKLASRDPKAAWLAMQVLVLKQLETMCAEEGARVRRDASLEQLEAASRLIELSLADGTLH